MKGIIKLSICLFILLLPHLVHAADYYWKGGNGDFNDPSKWTVGSAFGPDATQAPISSDNVFFLHWIMNSNGSATINFPSSANCNSVIVSGVFNAGITLTFISPNNVNWDVYGSLVINEATNFNFSGTLRFRSIKNGQETVDFKNNHLRLSQIEFDGSVNTEWVLMDSLVVDDPAADDDNYSWGLPGGTIILKNGKLNTNKKVVIADFFYSNNNSVNRSLMIDSSEIFLRGFNGGHSKAWWIDFDTSNYTAFSARGTKLNFVQSAGLRQYAIFGYGLEYDSIVFNSEVRIAGHASVKFMDAKESSYFLDARISIDEWRLSHEFEHYIEDAWGDDWLEIDTFYAPSSCADFISINGYAKSLGILRKKTPGTLNLNQVILQNMICDTTGGRSYTVTNGFNGGGNSNQITFMTTSFNKMKFVDSGNHLWSDVNNWRVWTGTGWSAAAAPCIPNVSTDVCFDNTSFPTSVKQLIVDSLAYCKNFIWEDVAPAGSYFTLNAKLQVFGKLRLSPNMGNIQMAESIYLRGSGDTIITNDKFLPMVIFWKYADYTVVGDINAGMLYGWLYSHIHASNVTFNANQFSLGDRDLHNVTCNIKSNFYDYGATLINYSGNTVFNFTDTANFVDVRAQKTYSYYNDVILPAVTSNGVQLNFNGVYLEVRGDLDLKGDAEFRATTASITGTMANYTGKMKLYANRTYSIKNLYIADSLLGQGTCNDIVTIKPYASNTGNINVSKADLYNCFIQGLNNQGTTISTVNCIDGGGNNGWVFNTTNGYTYYWRASATNPNDYVGDWSDPKHWTLNPNDLVGNLNGCMPTLSDTVVFDSLSFSATSNGVNIDNSAFCNTFIARADIKIGGANLYVSGSFFLDENMTGYHQNGNIFFIGAGNHQIDLKGSPLHACGVVFGNSNGVWNFEDDFYLVDSIAGCYTGFVLDAGRINLNGHELNIRGRFKAYRTNNYRVLDISNSEVNMYCNDRYNNYYGLTWDISNNTNMQLIADNSVVNFHANGGTHHFHKYMNMGDGFQYDRVNFLENDDITFINDNAHYGYAFFDGTSYINGSNSFDSIRLVGGHFMYLKSGSTQTLASEHGKIIVESNNVDFAFVESTNAGISANIHKEYGDAFCMDFIKVKDIHATKGLVDPVNPSRHNILYFETGQNSDNINNTATGIWAFTMPPPVTVTMSNPSTATVCNGGDTLRLPIELTGTYPYIVEVAWVNDIGESGVDTFYFMDDDFNVNTIHYDTITLLPRSNTSYNLQAYGRRCGFMGYDAIPTSFQANILQKPLAVQRKTGNCYLNNQDNYTHIFSDDDENMIVSVKDKVSPTDNQIIGNFSTSVYFDAVAQTYNGELYMPRHWIVNSDNDNVGKIRLYFHYSELAAMGLFSFNVANDLLVYRFPDTITVGVPDTIPYTQVSLGQYDLVPFSTVGNMFAIDIETTVQGAYMITTSQDLLPLDLLSFSADLQEDNSVDVKWITENEENISRFIVQKSSDGVNFSELEEVEALLGAGPNNYEVTDYSPYQSGTYYRLAIHDAAGIRYSQVVFIDGVQGGVRSVQVYPNPADGEVIVRFSSSLQNNDAFISIYNLHGQMIKEEQVTAFATQLNINTSDLPEGQYFMKINMGNDGVKTKRIVINH